MAEPDLVVGAEPQDPPFDDLGTPPSSESAAQEGLRLRERLLFDEGAQPFSCGDGIVPGIDRLRDDPQGESEVALDGDSEGLDEREGSLDPFSITTGEVETVDRGRGGVRGAVLRVGRVKAHREQRELSGSDAELEEADNLAGDLPELTLADGLLEAGEMARDQERWIGVADVDLDGAFADPDRVDAHSLVAEDTSAVA